MKKKARSKTKSKAAKKTKARKPVKAKAKVKKSSAKRPPAKTSKKAKKTKKVAVAAPRPSLIAPVGGVLLGFVEDYFAKIGVIALTLKGPVSVGQKIQVLGHTTNINQIVDSMQIEHASVTQATSGD